MLFPIFRARSAETNKPSGPTEDDTYQVLLRIPFYEMTRRLGEHQADLIHDRMYRELKIDRLNELELRFHRKAKWVRYNYKPVLFDFPLSMRTVGINMDAFTGSGWTFDTYTEEVKERLRRFIDKTTAEESLKKKKIILSSLVVGNITYWIGVAVGGVSILSLIIMMFTIVFIGIFVNILSGID